MPMPSKAEVQEAMRNAKARAGQPEFLVSEIFIPLDDPADRGRNAPLRR